MHYDFNDTRNDFADMGAIYPAVGIARFFLLHKNNILFT